VAQGGEQVVHGRFLSGETRRGGGFGGEVRRRAGRGREAPSVQEDETPRLDPNPPDLVNEETDFAPALGMPPRWTYLPLDTRARPE
jgi:hypothetical protein